MPVEPSLVVAYGVSFTLVCFGVAGLVSAGCYLYALLKLRALEREELRRNINE